MASCVLIHNPRIGNGFLESVRVLKNSFLNMIGSDEKVIMVTSTAPGEGKTTAAVNLAMSLADAEKKILIADCDVRNPSVVLALNPGDESQVPEGKMYITEESNVLGITLLRLSSDNKYFRKLINTANLKELFDSFRDNMILS